jgi:hypothetical protein
MILFCKAVMLNMSLFFVGSKSTKTSIAAPL